METSAEQQFGSMRIFLTTSLRVHSLSVVIPPERCVQSTGSDQGTQWWSTPSRGASAVLAVVTPEGHGRACAGMPAVKTAAGAVSSGQPVDTHGNAVTAERL